MSDLRLPGLIDCHVHFREPGLTQKGDLQSESRAAVAGGVTTVCEMPNTVPPTVSIAALQDKAERAAKIADCDIRFLFGATEAKHLEELRTLWTEEKWAKLKAKCVGLKAYFDHSTGDQRIGDAVMVSVFQLCGELHIPLVAHCEDAALNAAARAKNSEADVAAHSLVRPPESEERAVSLAVELAHKFRTPLHVAHLSTSGGLELIRQAKRDGISVTCEVAPHHLFLSTDDYKALGTLAKMNPPLRSNDHREALWEGIGDGTVDCIASDHAPHTLAEKQSGGPLSAPSGVPGVETMLPLLATVAFGKWPGVELRSTNYELRTEDIRRLLFDNPNRIFSLGASPAEIVTVREEEWVIRGAELHAKCGWTPYEGWRVVGRVELLRMEVGAS